MTLGGVVDSDSDIKGITKSKGIPRRHGIPVRNRTRHEYQDFFCWKSQSTAIGWGI